MLCSHYKQYHPSHAVDATVSAMKCRPVVHTHFTAVSWLVALVYRGVINDVTLCQHQMSKVNSRKIIPEQRTKNKFSAIPVWVAVISLEKSFPRHRGLLPNGSLTA